MTTAALPTISIVIPSLNHGIFLEQAIGSVLSQGYPALELIVMDGGSTDTSRAVIARHAAALSYWLSAPDGGPAEALNRGFAHSTGDILGFLNADDFLLPGALHAIARAFVAAPETDVISGHGYFATADGTLGAPMHSDEWSLKRFRFGTCVLLQPSTFFRRRAFERAGGVPQTGRVCWDMELWAALARSGARFATIDVFLSAFRLHDQSLTVRADSAERRRRDARAVMAEVAGHRETPFERLASLLFRLLKFARHPVRSLQRRAFFLSALRRWSL